MRIKEIRVGSPSSDVYVELEDGQVFQCQKEEIVNKDSIRNQLFRLITGESAWEFWERNTIPVWLKGEPGEVISNPKSPVKIFLRGIDFT